VRYRRLEAGHLPGVLALQEANLYTKLDAQERRDGFLSARFSAEQFGAMERDLAVIVAVDGEDVGGYLCASSLAFNRSIPLLAAMIECFPRLPFLGRALDAQRSFVYGPVCVSRERRGTGVLRGLYDALRREIAGEHDAGVLFIAKDNPRSLAAHADGLGMTLVGDFVFGDRGYWVLAFSVPAPPHC
jgi:hypothetical protein